MSMSHLVSDQPRPTYGIPVAMMVRNGTFTSSGNPVLFRRFFGPAATLARLPGWRLDHGADAATRLAAAQRLLGGVLAGAPGRP